MKAIKVLLLLSIIGAASYGYMIKEIYPAQVKSKNVIEKRQEASFLKIDDSVLKELSESKEYKAIVVPNQSDIGKEKLFDAPEKKNFSF